MAWQGGLFEGHSLELLGPQTPLWAVGPKPPGRRKPAIPAEP